MGRTSRDECLPGERDLQRDGSPEEGRGEESRPDNPRECSPRREESLLSSTRRPAGGERTRTSGWLPREAWRDDGRSPLHSLPDRGGPRLELGPPTFGGGEGTVAVVGDSPGDDPTSLQSTSSSSEVLPGDGEGSSSEETSSPWALRRHARAVFRDLFWISDCFHASRRSFRLFTPSARRRFRSASSGRGARAGRVRPLCI